MAWRQKRDTLAAGRRGYTLAEITIVIVILGVLASIAVPIYNRVRASSLESAAMHNTRLINLARSSYALTIPSGPSDWAGATDDASRLQLLITNSLLSGSAAEYLAMPGGYAVQLSGGLREQTILTHDGVAVPY